LSGFLKALFFKMQFYSTNNPSLRASFQDALFKGLPEDSGLYMPVEIPKLPTDFIQNLSTYSFQEISFVVASNLLKEAIPTQALRSIIERAIDFPAPVVALDETTHVLELFHGPSLAFKDFGARFMAQTMAYFNQDQDKELVILVATSGDTGGAVAAGFYKTPGIRVVILYPSGKVSPLQEQQLTTLGHNITALEVAGTFDDCQSLVKRAFLDATVTEKIRLSSANSINISRLIPQAFYYFEAMKQVVGYGLPIVFSVPSGNFGNLTAGILAKKMGLPVYKFVAATNANDVVPEYLSEGKYTPRPSVRTLSNAMDVGAPSNFARMLNLYCSTWNNMREEIEGFGFDDVATKNAMREIQANFNYVMDPHGAVGYLALKAFQKENPQKTLGVVLETAHPAKFEKDVQDVLGFPVEIPVRLENLRHQHKKAIQMDIDYSNFRIWLLSAL
jgi:threonine synthase